MFVSVVQQSYKSKRCRMHSTDRRRHVELPWPTAG